MTTAEQLKLVKAMLEMLNEQFPNNQDGIPSEGIFDGVRKKFKAIPPLHFTAHQCWVKHEKPLWWIKCTCWSAWRDEDFDHLSKSFQQIAEEGGFQVHFAFLYVVGLPGDMDFAKSKKCITLGRYHTIQVFD